MRATFQFFGCSENLEIYVPHHIYQGGHAVKYPARTPGGWVFPVLFLQDSKWVLRVGPAKWFKDAG